MKINRTRMAGLFTVVPDFIADERGFFAVIGNDELPRGEVVDDPSPCKAAQPRRWVQTSVSFNKVAGTLRGLHFQTEPNEQAKLIRCTRGSIQDVVVDFRPLSPTYKEWYAAVLTEDNRESLYVPTGFLHGYLTLEDNTEVEYSVSAPYDPGCAGGFRWDDPAFGIRWMIDPVVMSDVDANWPHIWY
jgi:dTDP-4-dehydrorhamnose 3,5-epimerase